MTDISKLKFKDMLTDTSVMKRGEREYLPLEKGYVGRYFKPRGELMFLIFNFFFKKEKKLSFLGKMICAIYIILTFNLP